MPDNTTDNLKLTAAAINSLRKIVAREDRGAPFKPLILHNLHLLLEAGLVISAFDEPFWRISPTEAGRNYLARLDAPKAGERPAPRSIPTDKAEQASETATAFKVGDRVRLKGVPNSPAGAIHEFLKYNLRPAARWCICDDRHYYACNYLDDLEHAPSSPTPPEPSGAASAEGMAFAKANLPQSIRDDHGSCVKLALAFDRATAALRADLTWKLSMARGELDATKIMRDRLAAENKALREAMPNADRLADAFQILRAHGFVTTAGMLERFAAKIRAALASTGETGDGNG